MDLILKQLNGDVLMVYIFRSLFALREYTLMVEPKSIA